MADFTEEKKYTFEIEPSGAISTKTQTEVYRDGELVSKNIHRGVCDPDNPEIKTKLGEVIDTTTINQQKTISAYSKDIADLSHEKNALLQDLIDKDTLIEKMTLSLQTKDSQIDSLVEEVRAKDMEIESLKFKE